MDRQVITVDIAPGSNAQQRLQVSQGDIGRPLGVRVVQNGIPLTCTGYTAHLYVLKPDHNYYECTCTISNNNLISWDTAEQETPVSGECLAEIRITSGTNDIGTACFVEYVEASPADLGHASESLISSMTEYVDAAQQAAEEASQIVEDVDNVVDVAINGSGNIVLTKRLGSTIESDESVKPGAYTAWGTTAQSTRSGGHFLVMINGYYMVQVWFPSSDMINILVIAGNGTIYNKEATDTITFGNTPNDTEVTMTRSGNTLTVTASSSKTITILNL